MNLQGWEIVGQSAFHVEFKNQKIWLWTVFYITHEENDKVISFEENDKMIDSPYWKLYTSLQRQIPIFLSLENKLLSSV